MIRLTCGMMKHTNDQSNLPYYCHLICLVNLKIFLLLIGYEDALPKLNHL